MLCYLIYEDATMNQYNICVHRYAFERMDVVGYNIQ